MKAQEDIEQQLAAAQDAWDMPPAPELWERLEQRLDAQLPTQATKAPRRWLFRIVTIALLATSGFGLWSLLPLGKAASSGQGKAFLGHETRFHMQAAVAAEQPTGLPLAQPAGIQPLSVTNGVPTINNATQLPPADYSSSPASPTFNANGFNQFKGNPAQAPIANALPSLNPGAHTLVVSNSMGNPIDTVSSLRQFRNLTLPQENAYLQINPSRNQVYFNYAGVTPVGNQQNLQHLKWLLGSW